MLLVLLMSVLILDTLSTEPLLSFLLLIVTVLVVVLMYYTVMKVKVVWINSNNLYVSNHVKEEVVPLENIRSVSENFLFSPRLIKVHFYHETMFGKQITFLGSLAPFLFFAIHPTVSIIRELQAAKLNRAE